MNRSNESSREEHSMQQPRVREQPYFLEIRDSYQHVLVLQGKTLIAVPYDGMVKPITLTVAPCRDESLERNKGNPIYLGIEDHQLCLCCAASGGQTVLQLEEREIMELYRAPKAEKSFVFYQNANGITSTFESANYPGWFISSSREMGKPIRMTKDVGNDNIDFFFNVRD